MMKESINDFHPQKKICLRNVQLTHTICGEPIKNLNYALATKKKITIDEAHLRPSRGSR